MELKPLFIHLKWIDALRCCTCFLRYANSDDVEPPPASATNPDLDPLLACALSLLVSKLCVSERVVSLVKVNLSFLAKRKLRTSISFVAFAEILSR